MKPITLQNSIETLLPPVTVPEQKQNDQVQSFGDFLKTSVDKVNERFQEADKATMDLATGKDTDIHNTMITLEKASVSFELMMQVRNKIIKAYETVMRMPV